MTDVKRILLNGSHPEYLLNLRGDLIKAFAQRGFEVHVTSPALDAGTVTKLEALGAIPHQVPLDRRGLGLLADLRYFAALLRLIRRISPDLVLGYTIKPNIWGSVAARFCRKPSATMVTGLGYAFIDGNGAMQKLVGAASRRLYRFATNGNRVVIFQNPQDRDDFIAAGALADPRKAKLVNGSGVDIDYFAPIPLPEQPAFLMIARLLGNKGAREYAQAATRLKEQGSEARFMLAGFLDHGVDAVAQTELDTWIASGIEFLGKLDDIRPAMAQANIYVLPSYREGTPRTVLEAMAMARAVITSDAPGCRETVIDGVTGVLVSVRDVDALAAAMGRIAADGDMRAAMGESGRQFCVERFAVDKVNRTLMEHLGLDPVASGDRPEA